MPASSVCRSSFRIVEHPRPLALSLAPSAVGIDLRCVNHVVMRLHRARACVAHVSGKAGCSGGRSFIAFRGWSGIEYRASESRQACSPPPSLFLHPPRSVIPLYQFRPARGRGRTEGGRKDQLYIPSWLTRARSCLAGLTCAPASNLNHSHCGGGGVTKFYFAVVPNEWTTAKNAVVFHDCRQNLSKAKTVVRPERGHFTSRCLLALGSNTPG